MYSSRATTAKDLRTTRQQGLLLHVSFNMKGLLKKFLFDHKLGNQGLAHGKIS